MTSVIPSLKALDVATLERLAGPTIVRAVKSAYDTNRSGQLARLIVDRYGTTLLKQREVRRCLLEQLDRETARQWCARLKLIVGSHGIPQRDLQDYFDKSYGEKKAKEFVEWFGLDPALIPVETTDERATTEVVGVKYGEDLKSKGFLHPYQKKVKDEILKNMRHGYPKQMVQMPTGSGKTVTALEVAVDVLREPDFDGLVIWIVDSSELAEQALQSFSLLWKFRGDFPVLAHRFFGNFDPQLDDASPGIVFAGFDKVRAQAAAADALTKNRMAALVRRVRLVIVDEAHSAVAETYEPVVRILVRKDAPLIGLSATPGRNDEFSQDELERLFGKTLVGLRDAAGARVEDAISYLRQEGYLATVAFEELHSGAQSSSAQESAVCQELAENAERNNQIIEQIYRAAELAEPTVVFSCTKDHVFALVALCRQKNLEVGFIVGETPSSQRVEILDRFRRSELKILINHEILSTGIDLPNVKRLIITRPVGSPILYSQIIGRALRGPRNGGSEKNTVVSIKDNLHSYPNASFVYEYFHLMFGNT
jgi:DNA repair protein RadD